MGQCADEAMGPALPRLDQVLTPRQLDVVDGIAAAYDNAQIARALGLSRHSVRNYVSEILQATGLCSRYELILVALEQGRVDLDARVAEIGLQRAGCLERNRYEW